MAFGFPAYHFEEIPKEPPDSDFLVLVSDAFRALGWSVHDQTGTSFVASTGFSIWSWGERIAVEIGESQTRVHSRCILFTQCFDWGKNRENVRRLIAMIDRQRIRWEDYSPP